MAAAVAVRQQAAARRWQRAARPWPARLQQASLSVEDETVWRANPHGACMFSATFLRNSPKTHGNATFAHGFRQLTSSLMTFGAASRR